MMPGFVLLLYFVCAYLIETIFRYNLLNPQKRVGGRAFLELEFGVRMTEKPSTDIIPREEYPVEEEYNAGNEAGDNCVVEEDSNSEDEYNEEYPVEEDPIREYDTEYEYDPIILPRRSKRLMAKKPVNYKNL